ncbi:MAG: hypothetical protein IJ775_04220 [Muribaculaceae bacterium]|nr:hypothetical protein [Muribaculaceae bacterium]
MDIAISKILSHVYELEGLLLVADKHGSDTPAIVYERIREHARNLHEMASLLEMPEPAEVQPAAAAVEETVLEPPAFNPPVNEPEPIDEPEHDSDDAPMPTPDDEPREVFTFDMPEPADKTLSSSEPALTGMRVDEKLQRSMSKDLRRAFSVNDRFRFRRELFGNSEAEFVDAINMVESMHSYSEATDYFLDDLGWDENVPEVDEFLNIVRHHFDE